ncbi:MAG: hypothetical protein ACRCW2_15915 [Cellulosilyticaceae bacterium]
MISIYSKDLVLAKSKCVLSIGLSRVSGEVQLQVALMQIEVGGHNPYSSGTIRTY